MDYNCIIVENQKEEIFKIQSFIKFIPSFHIASLCKNSFEAIEKIQNHKIDILIVPLTDIEIQGVRLIKSLSNCPHIIFTSHDATLAVEAFDLGALDFLLKPYTNERFFKAIHKFMITQEEKRPSVIPDPVGWNTKPFIYAKEQNTVNKVFISDIYFIESKREYVIIHTKNKSVLTKGSMNSFEEFLPSDEFIRIHKSYIVSHSKIRSFNAQSLETEKGFLPIGRNFKNFVLERLTPPINIAS